MSKVTFHDTVSVDVAGTLPAKGSKAPAFSLVNAELGESTLAAGESLEDFLADRSSYEEFDAQAAGEREYHFVELYQQAMRHLIG